MVNDTVKKIFNLKEDWDSKMPSIRTREKVNALLNPTEYNPFLDRSGNLFNKYIDYQAILDNPNVAQKAKEFISQATGLTSTPEATQAPVANIASMPSTDYGSPVTSSSVSGSSDSTVFANPVEGMKITSNFGMRKHPIDNVQKMHNGIDIAAPSGTPVQSVKGGKVTYVGDKNDGYGISVYVDNGNGMVTRYSHMQGANVKLGDTINQGQVIGKVGSTGKSTGPHLDFGVMINGKYVDPKQYLK